MHAGSIPACRTIFDNPIIEPYIKEIVCGKYGINCLDGTIVNTIHPSAAQLIFTALSFFMGKPCIGDQLGWFPLEDLAGTYRALTW